MLKVASLGLDELNKRMVALLVRLPSLNFLPLFDPHCLGIRNEQLRVVRERFVESRSCC